MCNIYTVEKKKSIMSICNHQIKVLVVTVLFAIIAVLSLIPDVTDPMGLTGMSMPIAISTGSVAAIGCLSLLACRGGGGMMFSPLSLFH